MQDLKSSKAAGTDKLSGKFLKDGADILAKPVSPFCNLSISWGVFPSACKVVKLKPIFKMGKKTDPSNYRLISLLPVISKIIEKVVHEQTNTFLSDENILYNYQSDFRENHSTNLCLSYLTDKILKGFDEGFLTGMILNNLEKAFDTTDHEILLQKLKAIRFSKGWLHVNEGQPGHPYSHILTKFCSNVPTFKKKKVSKIFSPNSKWFLRYWLLKVG